MSQKSKQDVEQRVLQILNRQEDENLSIYIDAKLAEILAYLNRDEVNEKMFNLVCQVIADCIKREDVFGEVLGGDIQSYSEGDISVSFGIKSPFFNRLEAFKVIRGIN